MVKFLFSQFSQNFTKIYFSFFFFRIRYIFYELSVGRVRLLLKLLVWNSNEEWSARALAVSFYTRWLWELKIFSFSQPNVQHCWLAFLYTNTWPDVAAVLLPMPYSNTLLLALSLLQSFRCCTQMMLFQFFFSLLLVLKPFVSL